MPRNEKLRFKEPIPALQALGALEDKNGNQFKIVVTGPEESVHTYLEELPLALEIRDVPTFEEPEVSRPELTLNVSIEVVTNPERPYILHCSIDKHIGLGERQEHGPFEDAECADLTFEVSQGRVHFALGEKGGSKVRFWRALEAGSKMALQRDKRYDGCWKITATGEEAANEYSVSGDFAIQ